MTDGVPKPIGSWLESLLDLERAAARRNFSLDNYASLVKSCRDGDGYIDKAAAHFQTFVDELETSLAAVEQKSGNTPAAVSSLGLPSYLMSQRGVSLKVPDSVVKMEEDDGQDGDGGDSSKQLGSLYQQLITGFSAHERYREYCNAAFNALSQASFRKSMDRGGSQSRIDKQRVYYHMPENSEVLSGILFPKTAFFFLFRAEVSSVHKKTEIYLRGLQPQLPGLTFAVHYLPGSGTAVEMVVDRSFRVIMLIRGMLIEGVNVRGSEEHFNLEPKSLRPLDLWSPSTLQVYRQLTLNFTEAILHFYTPFVPDTLRPYLQWMNSFAKLFVEPCRRCGKFLDQGLPPTWRDYKTLAPYHEACRKLTAALV